MLRALPATDVIDGVEIESRLAERVVERGEPVVPVVVPGKCEHQTARIAVGRRRQREPVGDLEALAICLAGRIGIDLVTAQDDELAARQPSRARHIDLVGGNQRGHREGRIEPVAQVGDVVDPHRPACGKAWMPRIVVALGNLGECRLREPVDRRLQDALVGELAEDTGEDVPPPGLGKEAGAVPVDHAGKLRNVGFREVVEIRHRSPLRRNMNWSAQWDRVSKDLAFSPA